MAVIINCVQKYTIRRKHFCVLNQPVVEAASERKKKKRTVDKCNTKKINILETVIKSFGRRKPNMNSS